MAVGAIEPQFFAQLLTGLGLTADEVPGQFERGRYDEMRAIFTERFANKTRDEWARIFAGTDACVTPVLTWARGGGQRAPAGARHTDRGRRRGPGRAGAAVLPHPASAPGAAAAVTKIDEIGW